MFPININCKPEVIAVYDSKTTGRVPSLTKKHIAAMVSSNEKKFTLTIQNVQQQQRGSNDCGLFALAFCASLCAGQQPEEVTYVQHLLRKHLANCFEQNAITPFPTSTRRKAPRGPVGIDTVEIFCVCRLPEGGRMIQCETCEDWFHSDCVSVPDYIWNSANSAEWHCDLCSCIKKCQDLC